MLYDADIERVSLPGTKGRFEVLKNHATLISSLTNGTVECTGTHPFTTEIGGGFVEVRDNVVTLCVEISN